MKPDDDHGPATKKGDDSTTPASPYGPHPRGVDEAAGGADSSPFENESTDSTKNAAAEKSGPAGSGPTEGQTQ